MIASQLAAPSLVPILNSDVAKIFEEIADLLEINDENPFRIRAYRSAARTIRNFKFQFHTLIGQGQFPKLPGIGQDLEEKVREIVATGRCLLLEALRRNFPPHFNDLLAIPGLGPKRVQRLNHALGISSIKQLREAAIAGKVRDIPGFGPKTEQSILSAIAVQAVHSGGFIRQTVMPQATALASYLSESTHIDRIAIAGSCRRLKDVVGDIDLLATGSDSGELMERFLSYGDVKVVLMRGPIRGSVILGSGIQVDLRFVPPESYGAALHYFTGSKPHNIALRQIAPAQKMKLNEYGLFKDGKRIAGDTEISVYQALGLPFIPPELREDRGEIAAARAGALPNLIAYNDLRGDLHVHTHYPDGKNTIIEMASTAALLGLEYIAITDHPEQRVGVNGFRRNDLIRQFSDIEAARKLHPEITILKGIETKILEDGSLDVPDSLLRELDIVVAAVDGNFDLSRASQTQRLLRALCNPHVNILAHPSSRLLPDRPPCEVDMLAVMRSAKERGIALELNSQPDRLDLDDLHCKMAHEEKVLIAIDSSARNSAELGYLRLGIDQARRGWIESCDVINTQSIEKIRSWLAQPKLPQSSPSHLVGHCGSQAERP